MNHDRAVLSLADTIILISVLLGAFVFSWWLLLTAFVGLNLLQSSLRGFCPGRTRRPLSRRLRRLRVPVDRTPRVGPDHLMRVTVTDAHRPG